MLNKESYKKAVLVITVFENDGIHTDALSGSGPNYARSSDMLPVLTLGNPISGLADLSGQRDTMGGE